MSVDLSNKLDFQAYFELNSIRNIKLCHSKDDLVTNTRADRQNVSVVYTYYLVRFNSVKNRETELVGPACCLYGALNHLHGKSMQYAQGTKPLHRLGKFNHALPFSSDLTLRFFLFFFCFFFFLSIFLVECRVAKVSVLTNVGPTLKGAIWTLKK